MDRQAGNKPTHDSLYSVRWNAPYTKESENMIDTKRIEVIAHLLKPLFPPGKPVFLHLLPVIRGELPVLTDGSKIIRRCAGLLIHVI